MHNLIDINKLYNRKRELEDLINKNQATYQDVIEHQILYCYYIHFQETKCLTKNCEYERFPDPCIFVLNKFIENKQLFKKFLCGNQVL